MLKMCSNHSIRNDDDSNQAYTEESTWCFPLNIKLYKVTNNGNIF